MNEFKKGDRVVCVKGQSPRLTTGRAYHVLAFSVGFVTVLDDRGECAGWFPQRFEMAPEEPVEGPPSGALTDPLWYLATPYTRFPGGHAQAAVVAATNAALLAAAGVKVFSPIAHSHALAETGELDHVDHEFWLSFDAAFMDRSDGIIYLLADGWDNSRGMTQELVKFLRAGKKVVFMQPGVVPEGLA